MLDFHVAKNVVLHYVLSDLVGIFGSAIAVNLYRLKSCVQFFFTVSRGREIWWKLEARPTILGIIRLCPGDK